MLVRQRLVLGLVRLGERGDLRLRVGGGLRLRGLDRLRRDLVRRRLCLLLEARRLLDRRLQLEAVDLNSASSAVMRSPALLAAAEAERLSRRELLVQRVVRFSQRVKFYPIEVRRPAASAIIPARRRPLPLAAPPAFSALSSSCSALFSRCSVTTRRLARDFSFSLASAIDRSSDMLSDGNFGWRRARFVTDGRHLDAAPDDVNLLPSSMDKNRNRS